MKRWLARLALALLVLTAEVIGRSLTRHLDVGRHVEVSYRDAAYYPFLLAAVKVGTALMLARLAWRLFQARRVAAVLSASPKLRLELSWKLWLASFAGTASVYLVQTGAEHAALHSSALPVFAVLAVFVAVIYRAVEHWLRDYEQIAAIAVALCRRVAVHRPPLARPRTAAARPPRRLFGIAFESRPPPLPAL